MSFFNWVLFFILKNTSFPSYFDSSFKICKSLMTAKSRDRLALKSVNYDGEIMIEQVGIAKIVDLGTLRMN